MKPETALAKSLTDTQLEDRRRQLAKEIPRLQSEYDAIVREHLHRRALKKHELKREAA